MGKLSQRQRYNWKARQVVETLIDESDQKKITVEFDEDSGHFSGSNALVIPSAKRKTKKLRDKNAAPVKLLSNKQKKMLKKVVDQKERKLRRVGILEELKKVQAKPEEMGILTSLQSTQTLGRRKFLKPSFMTDFNTEVKEKTDQTANSPNYLKWKVPKAVKRYLKERAQPPTKKQRSYDVVQTDSSSSSEDELNDEMESNTAEIPNKLTNITKEIPCNGTNNTKEIPCNGTTNTKEIPCNGINTTEQSSKCCSPMKPDDKNDSDEVICIPSDHKISPAQPQSEISTNNGEPVKNALEKKTIKILNRDPAIQKQRLKLPILSEEHVVMEAINENPFTIIVGPTGSGKTTQVPQFLYEAGYTSNGQIIGVTEPRRVAAISMSERVGLEMGLTSKNVSYQIRFEGNSSKSTEIKFMTDGVLFKELQQNNLLMNYSAIIIDEAHERSVYSDILIGILSRVVPKRNSIGKPLKLIIMSATLRIEDFTQNDKLFKGLIPPVIKIPSRMFEVTLNFNKETDQDYVAAAYRKVCKIHRQLPDGGILIFLTGQQEIKTLCNQLKSSFPLKKDYPEGKKSNFKQRIQNRKEKRKNKKQNTTSKGTPLPEINLSDYLNVSVDEKKDGDIHAEEDESVFESLRSSGMMEPEQPLWVLPLYSLLPPHKQRRVFDTPPEGTRLCVVTTNVAETSLTIPNIKYVVDSGKTKQKVHDPVTGVSSYHITWTSKASANQRAGRAGRTSEGFCYRIYSSAVFNDEFLEHTPPDILRRPIDDVILIMKALRIPVVTFPFPTPPDPMHLKEGIRRLIDLGALEEKIVRRRKSLNTVTPNLSNLIDHTVITSMGKSMSMLPISPRFAKMVLYSHQHEGILPYVILIIAALTVQEVLYEFPIGKEGLNARQKHWESVRLSWSGKGVSHLLGDIMVLIKGIITAERAKASYLWCEENGLRYKGLLEVRKLRHQLTNEINLLNPDINIILNPNMEHPNDKQVCILAEILLMGSFEYVARKVDTFYYTDSTEKQKWRNAYRTLHSNEPVFISSASVLNKERPMWIIYQDIYKTTKIYLRGVSAVNSSWIMNYGHRQCTFSPPLEKPPPRYNAKKDKIVCHRTATFGPLHWELPEAETPFPVGKDLYKWVAYFFLTGTLWPELKLYKDYLYDASTLIKPIAVRYVDKRENLIKALIAKQVTSAKTLEAAWRKNPKYLQSEYFAWFENEDSLLVLRNKWPPISVDDTWTI